MRLHIHSISEKEDINKIIEQQQIFSWDIPVYFAETKDYMIVTSPAWNIGGQTDKAIALDKALKDYFAGLM